jgi:hypothetical protein
MVDVMGVSHPAPDVKQIEIGTEKDDETVAAHVVALAREHSDHVIEGSLAVSKDFIARNRKEQSLRTFVIRENGGRIIASVCSLLWNGPLPLVFYEKGKLGAKKRVSFFPRFSSVKFFVSGLALGCLWIQLFAAEVLERRSCASVYITGTSCVA